MYIPLYHNVGTFLKYNRKIVESDKIDKYRTVLCYIATGISIKRGGIKLVLCAQSSLLILLTRVYVTVNLYNQELCIITEFSVIMYNY